MSSIREQLRLKGLYAEFDALKAEVSHLKARVAELENPPSDALQPHIDEAMFNAQSVPVKRGPGRPRKVVNG